MVTRAACPRGAGARGAAGFLLALLAAPPLAAETRYERADREVVCIVSNFPDGSQVLGSGFFVAPGVLATVRHQIVGSPRITAHLQKDGAVPARLIVEDPPRDAALLRVAGGVSAGMPLDARAPALGEEVFTIGCPLGLSHTLTRGVVSNPGREIEGRRLIQADLAINSGNSGGPLVNARGDVIGVVHGRLDGADGINFAIPAEAFLALLRRAGLAPTESNRLAAMWAAAARGEPETRARRYQELLLLAPWAAEAYYNLGLIRLRQDRLEEAREHFETASLKKSPYPEALNNLGLALFRQGRYTEARDVLIRAISAKPDFALAYLNLGVVYLEGFRDIASARKNFQRHAELAPTRASAKVARAWLGQKRERD
jgi:hypothetical protein